MSTASTDAEGTGRTLSTETKLFAGVAAFTFVIFLVYALTADDDAGKILLLITTVFSAVVALYLFSRDRRGGVAVDHDIADDADELWFPESSLWPLGIAGGAALVVAGLALGPWVWLPGGLLLIRSLWGFVLQSRARD